MSLQDIRRRFRLCRELAFSADTDAAREHYLALAREYDWYSA